jgi:hypothetical protein
MDNEMLMRDVEDVCVATANTHGFDLLSVIQRVIQANGYLNMIIIRTADQFAVHIQSNYLAILLKIKRLPGYNYARIQGKYLLLYFILIYILFIYLFITLFTILFNDFFWFT